MIERREPVPIGVAVGRTVMFKEGSGDRSVPVKRDPMPPEVKVALNIGPLGGSLATVSVIVVVPAVTVLVPMFSYSMPSMVLV